MSSTATPDRWLPARYRPLKLLGAGGMGEVWLAEDREAGRNVAVKRLKMAGAGAAAAADRLRFKREFMTLRQLDAPGVVKVFEQGESDDDLFYTMEAVEGWPLRDHLAGGHWLRGEPTPNYFATPEGLARVWALAGELFGVLAALHARGIVHRDLKPANLLVDRDGTLRLIDFGLARPAADAAITAAGEVLGTPSYLAPEQIRALPLDGRCDLYAAGVILFELAAGELPFRGTAVADLLLAHLQAAPPDPRRANPLISPAHAALILRLLAKEPGGRFPAALDARAALAAAASGSGPAEETAWLGAGAAPALESAPGLLVAPFIDAGGALAAADAAVRDLLSGRGGLLLAAGAPGTGKSRWLREVRAKAAGSGALAWAGAGRQSGGAPGQLFLDLFASVAAHLRARPAERAAWLGGDGAVLAHHFHSLRPLLDDTPAPAPLEPAAERARLQAALYLFFSRVAAQAPLLLLFDDLQWADPLSLELLAQLAASFTGAPGSGQPPLLIAGAQRAPLAEGDEAGRRLARLAPATRLTLPALDAGGVGALVQGVFGLPAPPPAAFSLRLHELTGGNPHFIEELLKGLVERGELRRETALLGEGGWNFTDWLAGATGRSLTDSLPGTLQSALVRRLEEWDESEREALRAAALIGREFRFEWWRRLSGLTEDRLLEIADAALRGDVLRETGPETLAFRQEPLRAALLLGLSGLKARRLHARVVEAIAAEPDAERHAELLAEHALAAALPEPAARFGHLAAARLLELQQMDAAEALLGRIESVAGAELADPVRLTHLRLLSQLHAFRGAAVPAKAATEAGVELAARLGDRAAEMELWLWRCIAEQSAGDFAASAAAGRWGLALARALGDLKMEARALNWIGLARIYEGNAEEATRLLGEALAKAEAAGDRDRMAAILNHRGAQAADRAEYDAAIVDLTAALAHAEATGNRRMAGLALNNLGMIALERGELDAAEAHLRGAHQIHRQVHNLRGMSYAMRLLGGCRLARGLPAEAAPLVDEAIAIVRGLADPMLEAECRVALAQVRQAGGDAAAARAEIDGALASFRTLHNGPGETTALVAAAGFALERGEWAAAADAARAALEPARACGYRVELALALSALALAERLGGGAGGADAFDEALRQVVEVHNFETELQVRLRAARFHLVAGAPARARAWLADAPARAAAAGFRPLAQSGEKLAEAISQRLDTH